MLEAAIAHYHSLLDDALARASQQRLSEEMQANNIFFGDRPVANVLRPRFLSAEQYALLQSACSLVGSAARRLAAAMLEQTAHAASVRAGLALTPQEEAL